MVFCHISTKGGGYAIRQYIFLTFCNTIQNFLWHLSVCLSSSYCKSSSNASKFAFVIHRYKITLSIENGEYMTKDFYTGTCKRIPIEYGPRGELQKSVF